VVVIEEQTCEDWVVCIFHIGCVRRFRFENMQTGKPKASRLLNSILWRLLVALVLVPHQVYPEKWVYTPRMDGKGRMIEPDSRITRIGGHFTLRVYLKERRRILRW